MAVNKWDLVADKQKKLKELRETLEERLAQVPGVALVAISAIAGRGLDKLMEAVFESYEVWNRRVSTPASQPLARARRWSGMRRPPPRAAASRSAS